MKRILCTLIIIVPAIMIAGSSFLLSCKGISDSKEIKNLAKLASLSGSSQFSDQLNYLNDGLIPNKSGVASIGGNRQPSRLSTQWVEFEWLQPVTTSEVEVFWWNFDNRFRLPHAYNIQYWDGNNYVPVNMGGWHTINRNPELCT